MKRRSIALILSIVFILSTINLTTFANIQVQVDSVTVDEVSYVEGEDPITGDIIIRPTMTISWENPDQWAQTQDGTNIHDPDYYEIILNNLTRGVSNTVRINGGSEEFTNQSVDLHEKLKIDTGSLYNVEVKPYHYHEIEGGSGYELAQNSGLPESAYAITDLNVDFETTESSIQITWDDLGSADFQYRIVYAIGDYTTQSKQELINNKEGEIVGLDSNSDGVTKYYDSSEKRNKLSYTVEEGIYPGQVYSIIVEPTVDYYNSESVMRNRNYPVIRTCSTNVELDLYEEGDYLRLEWDVPGSFKVGQDKEEYALVEATLLQYRNGQSSNVVIFDGDAAVIGYYKIPKPLKETDYQIKFVYRAVADQSKTAIEPVSNIISYAPSELMITPTRPIIPKLFSAGILEDLKAHYSTDQIRDILANEYLVPGYNYTGNLNNILNTNVTYHLLDNNQGINLIWGAFQRIDVDETSDTYNNYIFDSNVYYDIWVTDTLESMGYAKKLVDEVRYGDITSSNNITDGNKVYGYNQTLGHYYNDVTGELEPIIQGKLYYIKIVGKKKMTSGDLVSEPTIVSFYFGYDGDVYEPPVITKPPLEVKDEATTTNSATISWEEDWWEIISSDPNEVGALSTWRHEIWVDPDDGEIYEEAVAGAQYFAIYTGEAEITRLEAYLNELEDDLNLPDYPDIISRLVDLGQDAYDVSDIKYKFLRIPYEDVQAEIKKNQISDPNYSFDDYYEELIDADKDETNPLAWKDITPIGDPENIEKIIYEETGLLPNSTYLFMLYPYRVSNTGELLYAHYPTPIVVSTNPEEVVIHPDPVVPSLYISDYTDMSLTVAWKFNSDFEYELVYSLFEDVDEADAIEITIPEDEDDPDYPVDGEFFEVVVDDLFPNTEYYFWLRAKQPANNTTSLWSNAVLGKTSDVSNPYPPNGFGIASLEVMKKQGFNASVTDDYISVEWILDPSDIKQSSDKKVKKNYTYILEVSDNSQFIDPIYIESSGGSDDVAPDNVEILKKNLIKINDLVPNRPYYIRVKTRVIVIGEKDSQLIIKDSVSYSPTLRILTISTDDEYDGTIDPDSGVLPSNDYEVTYDSKTDTLDFRFRDDSEGADGSSDNNVDQRLISNLIEENIYTYTIDVSDYNYEPIVKRNVEIPYSIIEAFISYEIEIVIDAGDIVIELPKSSIASAVTAQVKQYGAAPSVEIKIENLGEDYLSDQKKDSSVRPVTDSQKVSVSVNSDKLYNKIAYFDKDITVKLLVNDKYEQFRVTRIGTVMDSSNKFTDISSSFDGDTGYMSFNTSKVGVYSGYVVDSNISKITSDKGHWSQSYREKVSLDYSIEGLDSYNPNSKVTEAEMINVIYGLLLGKKTIDLDAYISQNIVEELNYSGIKLNDSSTKSSITREEAINMMARVYEIMYDEIVQSNSTSLKAVNSNVNIGSSYKNGLAKAATVGLVSDISKSRPKDALKFGELFALWSKLID